MVKDVSFPEDNKGLEYGPKCEISALTHSHIDKKSVSTLPLCLKNAKYVQTCFFSTNDMLLTMQ